MKYAVKYRVNIYTLTDAVKYPLIKTGDVQEMTVEAGSEWQAAEEMYAKVRPLYPADTRKRQYEIETLEAQEVEE